LDKKGFTFIEAIAPCPTGYGRPNKLGSGLDEMRFYREMTEIRNGADLREAEIQLRERFIVGTFIDTTRPDFIQNYSEKVLARAKTKAKPKDKGRAA
jgi:2-oxoglutarate ferredoxin oxidoreductase subunit beta